MGTRDYIASSTLPYPSPRSDRDVHCCAGIAEPMPVAETFMFDDEDGVAVRDLAMLDTTVRAVLVSHHTMPLSLSLRACE